MRARLLAILLVLPVIAEGQVGRRPPIAGRTPPAPLPPQAPGITDIRLYTASRLTVAGYPTLGIIQTDRYVTDAASASYLLYGSGTRFEWRMKPTLSAAADLTAGVAYGQFYLSTAEVGGRYRPMSENSARPFVDLRTSFAYTWDGYAQPYVGPGSFAPPSTFYSPGSTESFGFGGLVGTGFDMSVSRDLSLSTGLSLSRHRMSTVRISGRQAGNDYAYDATTLRFTVALQYNHHRLTRLPGR